MRAVMHVFRARPAIRMGSNWLFLFPVGLDRSLVCWPIQPSQNHSSFPPIQSQNIFATIYKFTIPTATITHPPNRVQNLRFFQIAFKRYEGQQNEGKQEKEVEKINSGLLRKLNELESDLSFSSGN